NMLESRLADMRILVVDDQPANVMLVRSILKRAGYTTIRGESDPLAVHDVVREFEPDLIVLDLHMPRRDGFQVLDDLRRIRPRDEYLPVLVITADATPEVKRRALNGGASDFLTKPFDHVEARLRVRNLLQTRSLHIGLQRTNVHLEGLVRQRTAELEAAHGEILTRLALAAEFRDDATGQHTSRVGRLSRLVAQELGLPDQSVDLI